MQPIGQLDEQHTDIAGDGDQELAEIFGLFGLLGDEVELLDFGQTIDQCANLLAELQVDLGARNVGVLDHVVQQGRRNGGVVELELGQDGCDFEGMRKVGITGEAFLVPVRPHGINIGTVEQRLVGARIVLLDPFHQLVLAHHATPRAPAPPAGSDNTPLREPSPLKSTARPPAAVEEDQRPPRPDPPPEEPPLAEGSVGVRLSMPRNSCSSVMTSTCVSVL